MKLKCFACSGKGNVRSECANLLRKKKFKVSYMIEETNGSSSLDDRSESDIGEEDTNDVQAHMTIMGSISDDPLDDITTHTNIFRFTSSTDKQVVEDDDAPDGEMSDKNQSSDEELTLLDIV